METAMRKRKAKDIVGQKFGCWTVLERIEKRRTTYWNCVCDCGELGCIRNDAIYKAKKCCHKKYIDITGQRFGKLVAIKRDGISPDRAAKWKCKCDCGKEISVISYNLRHGHSRSCGCGKAEYNSIALTIPENGSYINRMYRQYSRHKNKNGKYEFNLTKEQFKSLIEQDCFYCGKKSNPYTHNTKEINGVDRLDSTVGYTIENCVPCCTQCNIAKNTTPYDEFMRWIEKVYNYNLKLKKLAS